jgi:hypothetical protein
MAITSGGLMVAIARVTVAVANDGTFSYAGTVERLA